ncbi:hypothetical protein ACFQT0_09025 [Hymenobacter humi]|uniref:WD40 repeat domain-containing protein n=1 Tax=Hymenobacter humi TaxID=1411620 RepID=A0ABW2U3Q6_9BACT
MQKRYEVLAGLPPYGPMAVSVPQGEYEDGSEGYVVRFYQPDGSSWVANFAPGLSNFSMVLDYPDTDRTIVIASGEGYVMAVDQEKPLSTFGGAVKSVFATGHGEVALVDDLCVVVVSSTGELWQSERIAWDGIKDVVISGRKLMGWAYDPTDSIREWKSFAIDLDTKEVWGGSYNTKNWFQLD